MATVRLEGGREVEAAAYVEEVVGRFRQRLTERYASGTAVTPVEDPGAVADRLALLVPLVQPGNPMAELVGPFYDTAGMRTLLGSTRQAIHDRTVRGTLLGVQTGEGQWIYPTFQLDGDQPRKDVVEVLKVLRGGPRWSVAVWLCTPDEALDRLSPEQWLTKGGDLDAVLRLARGLAHDWAA
ncbi:hypothetical protein GCM10023339_04800 [Alloalcanivorax gelatiniphagus]